MSPLNIENSPEPHSAAFPAIHAGMTVIQLKLRSSPPTPSPKGNKSACCGLICFGGGGVKIHFAHRTFQWSSEAKGKAGVHCVIVGFALHDATDKRLFDYAPPQAEPHEVKAKNINPYLVDGPDLVLGNRKSAICNVPKIIKGSQPTDGGNFLLLRNERATLLIQEPTATLWLRRFEGSEEFINGSERWCLWLKGCKPEQLSKMPTVMERVEEVRNMRLSSPKLDTVRWADMPTLFTEDRQPTTPYLLIPSVSSEIKRYIPIGFVQPEVIASNLVLTIPNATIYHFGILSSTIHMAWMRSVCGRLESRYCYSAGIVYNNFPWPQLPTDKQRQTIEDAAQAVPNIPAPRLPTCTTR